MNLSPQQLSNNRINKAGDALISEDASRTLAFEVVNQWRASYSGPMRVVALLLTRAALRINRQAIVSSRLKRMESIVAKLQRFKKGKMRLATMQDIGGCRVVFWPIDEVRQFMQKYSSFLASPNIKISNYIEQPKPDGYRGIHVVIRYKSNSLHFSHWDDKRIEIQIRSTLQHAWATAVETVDLFAGQTLKSGSGEEKWRRFFVLASSVFARLENSPIVVGTPEDQNILKAELAALWDELNVLHLLLGWATAAGRLPEVLKDSPIASDATIFLLMVNLDEKTVYISPYTSEQIDDANRDYAFREEVIRKGYRAQVVLVSIEKVEQLKRAFPNFYADTSDFLKAIELFVRD